jgi:ribonuclease HII
MDNLQSLISTRQVAMPDFSIEDGLGGGLVAGVDEVGRGAWAGPVVAAAVIVLDRGALPSGIDDSKKVSARRREAVAREVARLAEDGRILFGLGEATPEEIERHRISAATKMAMVRALHCLGRSPAAIIVDGLDSRIGIEGIPVIASAKADAKSVSVAAASIVAKVYRDRIMMARSRLFPVYGWERNVGYGSRQHEEAIRAHGTTDDHRPSFLRRVLAAP